MLAAWRVRAARRPVVSPSTAPSTRPVEPSAVEEEKKAVARVAAEQKLDPYFLGRWFAALNPARDLGPRIVHALIPLRHKGPSDWRYSWVPVAAPILGGLINEYEAAA